MQVSVEIVPGLTQAFGHSGTDQLVIEKTIVDNATLADLLSALIKEYPEFAEYALARDGVTPVCPHILVALNGEIIAVHKKLDLVLRDRDVLVLLPAFSGG
jgi:molybdopterin converting factor small subunit